MPSTETYNTAVLDSFHRKALKSVLLIDDQFPTYLDVIRGETAKFTEYEKASRLYQAFHARKMICDVENDVTECEVGIERFKKSDLIILDYHLSPTSNDGTKAVEVVRRLSLSTHFNTIILYTRHTDLGQVWLEVAGMLRQGWGKDAEDVFAGDDADEYLEQWDRLSDQLPHPPLELVRAYVTHGRDGWSRLPGKARYLQELQEKGLGRKYLYRFVDALICRYMWEVLKSDYSKSANDVAGNYDPERGLCWLQAGNCFVAIAKKHEEHAGAADDPDGLMACLDAALLDWKPSLLQVIGSEIQNLLEVQAIAFDRINLKDPHVRTGLAYFMLDSLGPGDVEDDRVWASVETIIDKLVDVLRRRIGDSEELRAMATAVFKEQLDATTWKTDKWAAAVQLSAPPSKPKMVDVGFELNRFLSNEPKPRRHLTTGSIFQLAGSNDFWICVSPSCEMVNRVPNTSQAWQHSIYPIMPMFCLRLHEVKDLSKVLGEAHLGRHLFVKADGVNRAFCIENSVPQLTWEFLILPETSRLETGDRQNPTFKALQLSKGTGGSPLMSPCEFIVVGQLRPAHASKFLLESGQHLSRIGLDHVSFKA
ncbi:MAG: hypothetical protein RLY86_3680 [Pseudomonadota bacterium]|jgi:hypothetical protein